MVADIIGAMRGDQRLSRQAETAIRYHCRLSIETMHPRFAIIDPAGFSVVLTVNSGYE